MLPPPLRWNSFHGWLPVTGPVKLPNVHHTGPHCSTHQRDRVLGYGAGTFDSLPGTPSLRVPSSSDPVLPPSRALLLQNLTQREVFMFLQFNFNGIQGIQAPQSSHRHPPPPHPRPRLLRATLKSSIHHILRGMRVRGDDPNAPYCHLWRRPGGGHISLGQTPPTRQDDWGDGLVSGSQQCTVGCPPTSVPSQTTAASVL